MANNEITRQTDENVSEDVDEEENTKVCQPKIAF